MAEALLRGGLGCLFPAVFENPSRELKKIGLIKHIVSKVQEIVECLRPILEDMEKLNSEGSGQKEETDMLINQLNQADELTRKWKNSRFNIQKRYRCALEFEGLYISLLNFIRGNASALNARGRGALIEKLMMVSGIPLEERLVIDGSSLNPSTAVVLHQGGSGSSLFTLYEDAFREWRKIVYFKSKLPKVQESVAYLRPILEDMEKLNSEVNGRKEETDMLISLLKQADDLIRECEKSYRFNILKRYTFALKLDDLSVELLNFIHVHVLAQNYRGDLIEKLVMVSGVPLEEGAAVIGFEDRVRDLKDMVLKDSPDDDDCSVVVVSAVAGSGKTTLVKKLCQAPEIEAKYRENVFYVAVSETPEFMVIVNNLLNSRSSVPPKDMVRNNEVAKYMLEKFFRVQVFGPILLVLDGVRSALFIRHFEFKIRGYKILVTSKMIFPKYDVFLFNPLSDEDAKAVFKLSAFSDHETIQSHTIDDDLVNQMVKCCKKHPLTLSMVGSSLNGKYSFVWKSVIKTLSQGKGILYNRYETRRLQNIIGQSDEEFEKHLLDFEALDEELKQCLLDLGLFPSDYRVPAGALLDMWTNLYGHDVVGRDTLIKILQLSYRNLLSSITIGEEANAVVNYCDQTFVTRQDLQRELAIHFSSKEPISRRTRLIIDVKGNDLPASVRRVEEVMSTRILSISTGESFSSRWCNMNVPNVEVMILNIMSKTYTLPHFLEDMQELKVLTVINYGLHPTEFVNFHLLGSLTGLTRIRLERVVLSLFTTSILTLVNLEKISFIMCKAGKSFEKISIDNPNIWPKLAEIEIDSCQDLVGFSGLFCSSIHLEKLSITNCDELIEIPEEIGKLASLEIVSLRSCTKLEKLPDSFSRLKKLTILDISNCLSLSKFPENIGELDGLRMIYMKGCTGIHELPPSVKDLTQPQVLCDKEISCKWQEFPNVKIPEVEEDRLFNLSENIL